MSMLTRYRRITVTVRFSITTRFKKENHREQGRRALRVFLQGFRLVMAEECWHKSLTPLMGEIREQMGDGPVYLTFDIDGLDPSIAPGTGGYTCMC